MTKRPPAIYRDPVAAVSILTKHLSRMEIAVELAKKETIPGSMIAACLVEIEANIKEISKLIGRK